MNISTLSGSLQKRNAIVRFVVERRKTIVEVISSLFILLFLYTALNKSFQIGSTVNALKQTPFLKNVAESTAWEVVMVEYIAVLLLYFPKTRKAGLYVSLILMSGFTIYISFMMAFATHLPCSCGGVIAKMSWTQHLIFNILFALLALTAIILCKRQFKPKREIETASLTIN